MANEDQIKFWDGEGGARWVEHQAALDDMLAPFIPAVLSAAALQKGERVVDVGCGAGALTLEAEKIAGEAVGVDVSAGLLDLARRRADATGAATRFEQADAAVWRAHTQFDVLISRFGVMFFDDPTAAFVNLRRAMAPAGRLCFVCWRPMPENAWVAEPLRAALPFLKTPPTPPPPGAPGPFAFGDRVHVEDVLDAAGWTDLIVEPWDGGITFPGRTARQAAEFALQVGPVGRLFQEQDIDPAPALERLTETLAASLGDDGRVRMSGAAWIVRARAA